MNLTKNCKVPLSLVVRNATGEKIQVKACVHASVSEVFNILHRHCSALFFSVDSKACLKHDINRHWYLICNGNDTYVVCTSFSDNSLSVEQKDPLITLQLRRFLHKALYRNQNNLLKITIRLATCHNTF